MSKGYHEIIENFNNSNRIFKRSYACVMWNYYQGLYDPDVLCTQSWEDIVIQTASIIRDQQWPQTHTDLQKIQVPSLIYHIVKHFGGGKPFSWWGLDTEYELGDDGRYVGKFVARQKLSIGAIKAKNDFFRDELNVYDYLEPVVGSFAGVSNFSPYAQDFFYNTEQYITIWNPVSWAGEQIGPGWTIGAYNIVPGVVKIFVPYGESFASQIDEQLVCDTHTWAAIVKPVEKLPDYFIEFAKEKNFPLKTPGCKVVQFSKYRQG